MPTILVNEGRTLEFSFDDDWSVCAWDQEDAYRDGIRVLDETKAVDFLGIYRGKRLVFIEVKDCRVDPTSNKARLGFPLAAEVGQKARDTIAGFVAAARRGINDGKWHPFAEMVRTSDTPVHVFLWLEMIPTHPAVGRRIQWKENAKVGIHSVSQILKKQVGWLSCKPSVQNLDEHAMLKSLGVSVRNLQGAGLPNAPRTGQNP
jgi:hypothetical protein